MQGERRVVITGLGVVSPFGIGIAPFWDALIQRRSGIDRIQAFDASTFPSSVGGEVPAFKAADFVPKTYRKNLKLMSRDIELAVAAAYQAAKDASLPTPCMRDRGEPIKGKINPTRFGANIGAGLICPELNELGSAFATALDDAGNFDLSLWGAGGMENLTPLWLLKFLPNMLACHVTIVHDAQALSNTITCGEASSHLAIGEAFRNIARGAMDVCVCGGAESKINPMGVTRAILMNRLNVDAPSDPAAACRPFATDRRGTVAAEGGGLIILESLDHAQGRGVRIYAEMAGFGATCNTHSWNQPDPSGKGLASAIRGALADAEIAPQSIDLVSTFGCGSPDHDASELRAWNTALGDHAVDLPAIAIKGALGNNGAGSGALDFCAMILALYNNTVPPSINTQPLDTACKLRFAAEDPVDCPVEAAVGAAYTLAGGQNAALVVKRFKE